MKKRITNKKAFIITTILCLLPMLLGAYFYKELPREIPTKWYMDGTVGQYMPKEVTIFGLPAMMAVINTLVHFGLNTDPKTGNIARKTKALGKWICPVLSLLLVPMSIFWALGKDVPVEQSITFLIGVVFIAAGNYMPKCRRNYTSGIKLPWTLNSDENWRKTHHLAGFLWIFAGAFMIVTAFVNALVMKYFILAALLVILFIPAVYSYLLYRKGI